jgi:hypothetical protein
MVIVGIFCDESVISISMLLLGEKYNLPNPMFFVLPATVTLETEKSCGMDSSWWQHPGAKDYYNGHFSAK